MTDAMTIVPMTLEHLAAAMPFERDMFGSEAWTESSYRTELADPRRAYFAAVDEDGGLLGWAGTMVNGETADIMTVGTLPIARRRGIGTALVHALIAEDRLRGATEVLLEVRIDNAAARALYEREGFASIGIRRGYYDYGRVDAITMRLELTS